MVFDYQKEYHHYKKYYLTNLQGVYQQPLTRASLGLTLTLATVSFFAFFALKPTIVTIASLVREIKVKKEINQKLGQKISALNEARISFAQVSESIPFIEKTLPQKADFLRLEQELEFLSFKNDLVVDNAYFDKFNFYEKVPKPGTKTLSFKLTLAGPYENLKNFLSELENLDRLTILNEVSFSKETDVEGAELQIDLSGEVYYSPPGELTPSPAEEPEDEEKERLLPPVEEKLEK